MMMMMMMMMSFLYGIVRSILSSPKLYTPAKQTLHRWHEHRSEMRQHQCRLTSDLSFDCLRIVTHLPGDLWVLWSLT